MGDKEQSELRKKRRIRILSFYDCYLFNTHYDEEDESESEVKEQYVDIDADYDAVRQSVQSEHEKLRQNDSLFCREEIRLRLYAIKEEEMSLEKEWMRNLRKRKFRSYQNRKKNQAKRMRREEIEINLNELVEQIEIVSNTKRVEMMNSEVVRLEEQRLLLIENTAKQIDELRKIIKYLNQIHLHKTSAGFISVS